MIPERYRSEYDGEYVVVDTIFSGGKKEQVREWVENPIKNKHMGRATCLSRAPSTDGFMFKSLEDHKGGLLGSKAMQVYGSGDSYKDLKCDFLVAMDQKTLNGIMEIGYQEKTSVYTTARLCIDNQSEFYLIPHGFKSTPEAVAVWLACFDEHKEIFLFGYDPVDNDNNYRSKMINSVNDVILAYQSTKFYAVGNYELPESWKYHLNLKQMDVYEYVSYTDT